MSEILNINLAPLGKTKIDWVKAHMPVLGEIEKRFKAEQPFKGLKVALSVHLEAKTAYLCKVLAAGGAEMYVTGSNPLSTVDEVAAALVADGLNVFARYNASESEYRSALRSVLSISPNIIIDDGGELVEMMHSEFSANLSEVIGGCEETTTGITSLKKMKAAGRLKFPMMLVNDADCKHLFDNRYGTGQSVWDAIMRTTNLIIAGKTVVVSGFGWCGKGVAARADGLGAKVVITEVNPVRAIEAHMEGYAVMPMSEASRIGDIFVSVTGCSGIVSGPDIMNLKEGAILTNAGHFDVEIDTKALEELSTEVFEARHNILGYKLKNGRTVYLISEGRLVNLAAAEGHPAEIMDMSFAIQALSAEYLVKNRHNLEAELIPVPKEIDNFVARLKLKSLGISIDELTEEQREYLGK
ncbi:MAG: adenosylhomocysteinase [Clostridiales bacterium]|nr:adenosylhomocysteinase [Clostridiales bacterium]